MASVILLLVSASNQTDLEKGKLEAFGLNSRKMSVVCNGY